MKETMEVRLRHEQRRGDFLAGKVQQTEGSLRDITAQLDAANRRVSDQRAEAAQLQEQVAQLQSDLAASHAAHLALQQHHTASMEAAAQEKQQLEEQHRKIVETLQQDLTAAGGAAAALSESSRQVEALRLLYNEELSRASRLAVELSRATAAADKATAAEDSWRRQLAKSDSRADNAEGMAGAMKATVRQLEEQLAQEQARLEASKVVTSLASKLEAAQSSLSVTQRSLTSTEDSLKLRLMELEGANAQLQAGRSHMKQLMSDLETEQERTAGLTADLAKTRDAAEEAAAARETAEGRVKKLQGQLSKANDSSAALSQKLQETQVSLEACTEDLDQLRHEHSSEKAAHAALRQEAGQLRGRLAELGGVEEKLASLQQQHTAAEAKLEQLEQEKLMAGLQQLMQAEAHKHQEVFDSALKGLSEKGFAPMLNPAAFAPPPSNPGGFASNMASLQLGFQEASLSAIDSVNSPCSINSPSAAAAGPGGGMLSGFVSLATYQEQMQSVASLHSQDAVSRTTALRGALGQLHGQLEELRTDHAALQDAHRALVAKDLMKSGLLKDRYVADLFARLQEAEWKLGIARKRAVTWGYESMVPLGRVDRGIQTQYAEVLLPAGALLLLRRMLGWPGMLPLLRWVAGGHFLVGLRDGSLGSLLADVQLWVRWVAGGHFLVGLRDGSLGSLLADVQVRL
ncbi:hypothetical protein OEZ85_013346 [Tetradesmus obliquus]|uniref:Uncharacterized protein n=1 Tax=Tetradesmus obliquus TaxID=3088 RepID=A0ABY8U7Q9_TETOB|nr:hypothetical protein OEZ85_013346 [Tetradesmus obliquus]